MELYISYPHTFIDKTLKYDVLGGEMSQIRKRLKIKKNFNAIFQPNNSLIKKF